MALTTMGVVHFLHSGMSWGTTSVDSYNDGYSLSWLMRESFADTSEGTADGPNLMFFNETTDVLADPSKWSLPIDRNSASVTHSFVDECSIAENPDGLVLKSSSGTIPLSKQPFMPTFIIAGAQKSGTSALYYLLKTMQKLSTKNNITAIAATDRTFSIHSSIKFESHFFTHQMKQFNNQMMDHHDICTLRQLYRQEFDIPTDLFDRPNHSIVTFEKSPIYLCKPQIPSFIHQVAPWTKILVLLRNPIDRAFSNWKMDQTRTLHHNRMYHANRTNSSTAAITHTANATAVNKKKKKKLHILQSFRQVVDKEVTLLRKLNLTMAPTLSSYLDATVVERQQFSFRLVKSLAERNGGDMHHSHTTSAYMYHYRKSLAYPLSRGMYAQQLYFWLHPEDGGIGPFRRGKDLHIIPYEFFSRNRTAVLQTVLQDVLGWNMNVASMGPSHLEKDYSPGRYGNPTLKRQRWGQKDSPRNATTANRTLFLQQILLLGEINDDEYHSSDDETDIHATLTDEELLHLKMHILVREYLQQFYQPYQEELVSLLGTEWQHLWKE
jgi:Sulfotransferase family